MVVTPGQVKSKTKIAICCFCTKHVVLTNKYKKWFAQNWDNVSEWKDKST